MYVCIAYVCRYRGTLSAAWEMIWKASRFSFGSVRYAVYWRLTAPLRSSCIDSALPTHSWASVMLFPNTILPSIAISTSPLCTLCHGVRITSTDPHTCTQHAHHITCICPWARSSAAIYNAFCSLRLALRLENTPQGIVAVGAADKALHCGKRYTQYLVVCPSLVTPQALEAIEPSRMRLILISPPCVDSSKEMPHKL